MTSMLRHRTFAAALFASVVAVAAGSTSVADDELGPTVPGEFIVELKPEADPAAINRALGGVAPPERLTPASALWLFRLAASSEPEDTTKRIENTNHVVNAQPNVLAELPEFSGGRVRFWTDLGPPEPTATADAASIEQPALGNTGLPASGPTGAGVTVAVLDTGLDAGHGAFDGRVVPGGWDFVDGDAEPADVGNGVDDNGNDLVDEAFGHGTYVAGIATMVADGASIMPIRIIDTDGVSTAWRILQGLDLAVRTGADVVNLSLGGGYLGEIVDKAFEQVEKLGVVAVAAAGNTGTTTLRYPAAYGGVVGVTAIDGSTGSVATFANAGSWIDVAAPGVRIVSAFPGGRYATWGGTSASAPIVAGALAVVREAMPAADVDDVVDRLTSTAIDDGLANVSSYGRVDVGAAVARALAG